MCKRLKKHKLLGCILLGVRKDSKDDKHDCQNFSKNLKLEFTIENKEY